MINRFFKSGEDLENRLDNGFFSRLGRKATEKLLDAAYYVSPRFAMRLGAAVLGYMFTEAVLNSEAMATPVWTNLNQYASEPYSDPIYGDVREFQHQVKNISTEGESLKTYRFPAGSNNGIVDGAIDGGGWSATINPDETILSAIGAANEKKVDETAVFKFLTTDLYEAGDTTEPAQGKSEYDEIFRLNTETGDTTMPVNIPATPPPSYQIISKANPGGTVDPSGTNNYEHGTQLEFKFNPDEGKEVLKGTTNDVDVAEIARGDTNWVYSVVGPIEFEVFFTNKLYQIISRSTGNGSVSPSGTNNYEHGTQLEFDFNPDLGKEFLRVRTNGTEVAGLTRGDTNWVWTVASPLELEVDFTNKQYQIISRAYDGGSVAPSGTNNYEHGTQLEFNFNPDEGKELLKAKTNGVDVVGISRGDTNWVWTVNGPLTLDAYFTDKEQPKPKGTIFKFCENEQPNGYTLGLGDLVIGQNYAIQTTGDLRSDKWAPVTNFTSNSVMTNIDIVCDKPKAYFKLVHDI